MSERLVIFDTETTGLNPEKERVTEIGLVEMIDGEVTGRYYHTYVRSGQDIPKIVVDLTGITKNFLEDKPLFRDVYKSMLEFIGDSKIVAHNANFDMRFINMELRRINKDEITQDRFIDTVRMFNEKHPGKKSSLDKIMKFYKIDSSIRTKHGAVIDAYLLSLVYKILTKKEKTLFEEIDLEEEKDVVKIEIRTRPEPLNSLLTEEEKERHNQFISRLEVDYGVKTIWTKHKERVAARRQSLTQS